MKDLKDVIFRLLICDDHQIFCQGLKELVSREFSNIEVLVANDVIRAQQLLNQFKFDVFICDINIQNENGLNLIERNVPILSDTNVIVLTGYLEEHMLRRARRLGVNYFLRKEVGIEELISAINRDLEETWWNKVSKQPEVSNKNVLSRQEREIVKLIIDGCLSKEIADRLHISKSTVDTHRRNIHRKLNTTNSTDLFKLVYEGNIEI